MKKVLLLAAAVSALSLSGIAVAQDTDQPAPTDQAMPAEQPMPAEHAAPAMAAPSNAMPTPQPSTENYPLCSRTVTDKCVNPSQAGHHAWHKSAAHHHKAGARHHKGRAHHAHHAHKVVKKTTTATK